MNKIPAAEKKARLLPEIEYDVPQAKKKARFRLASRHPLFYAFLPVITLVAAYFFVSMLSSYFLRGGLWGSQYSSQPIPHQPTSTESLEFDDIVPSETLQWHPCFVEQFRCARLTVPMDYNRPLSESEDNPKVHIALLLVPGKHNGTKKVSTSPLLLNPGGPGGSGTMLALSSGAAIQAIVGDDQDVIGFDPRGIGSTTPRADCFSYPYVDPAKGQDDDIARGNFHRQMWSLQSIEAGLANASTGSLQKLDSRARALSKLCSMKDEMNGRDSILRHASTPSVARDMISIIDAWDEWTAKLAKEDCIEKSIPLVEEQVENSLETKGKLVYWGFSYGTLLGATFAAMFPDRVGRVVLDGVVDADHYVAPVWMESTRDADANYNSFSKYCLRGKERCALYREGDSKENIEERVNEAIAIVKTHPFSGVDPLTKQPMVYGYDELKSLIFFSLYVPVTVWPILAAAFDLILNGKGQGFAENGRFIYPDLKLTCAPPLPRWIYPGDAQNVIMCSDKRYPLNETLPGLKNMLATMSNESSFADVWMTVMIGCNAWPIKAVDPPMRWDDHPAHNPEPIKTSNPVLFISNTYDPVTPIRAGLKMAKKFVNAGFFEQQSEGHCSIFSAVSSCTIEKVRNYFQTGEVPEIDSNGDWEKCKADEWPFHPFESSTYASVEGVDDGMIERMQAAQVLQHNSQQLKHWGQPSMDGYSTVAMLKKFMSEL